MKFGLSDQQYHFILEKVVKPIETLQGQVWCYGSRARGDHKPFSDLDLMVECQQDLTKPISQIQELLTESLFPFKVDLVQLRDFADSYKTGYEQDKKVFLPK